VETSLKRVGAGVSAATNFGSLLPGTGTR